ncbi:MAG: right-handed parallel beta-helix repeat-containing protein [Verrucomicrobiales bacterium]|jgi:hypothetical protein|nr:right-handed parallel beta-helix repeat-containing protein [Verrucomicrobiales bacterium]
MNPKLTLLTLCALSVSALNVLAQNFVVTSDTTVSGTHYENSGTNYAALTNSGTWTFTGSDVILTATADSGNGRTGVRNVGGGTVNLVDSVINAVNAGVTLSGTSVGFLNNVQINADGIGVTVGTQSEVELRDVTIHAADRGVNISGTSTGTLHNVNITTTSTHGLNLSNASTATVSGGTITTTGATGYGVMVGTQSGITLQM